MACQQFGSMNVNEKVSCCLEAWLKWHSTAISRNVTSHGARDFNNLLCIFQKEILTERVHTDLISALIFSKLLVNLSVSLVSEARCSSWLLDTSLLKPAILASCSRTACRILSNQDWPVTQLFWETGSDDYGDSRLCWGLFRVSQKPLSFRLVRWSKSKAWNGLSLNNEMTPESLTMTFQNTLVLVGLSLRMDHDHDHNSTSEEWNPFIKHYVILCKRATSG